MKFYGLLFLLTYLIVFGCAAPEIDEVMLATQFQDAQQAINNAAELGAEPLVPDEFGRAVKLLNFARNSQENGDIPQSAEFAYQAELVAQIASAKARQHHAQQKVVAIREQIYQQAIKSLEHELEIERTRQAITEEQLARTLRSRDEGQQQTDQFSSEIADLKIKLRQAELRVPLVNIESLVNIAAEIYPAIKKTADYERVQAAIALIVNLIEQKSFHDVENATIDAQTLVNNLYRLAVRNREAEAEARTNAQISIAKAEVIIQRAQYFNASQHAPKQLQEASSHLQRAKQELEVNRYEQSQQSAQQAQQAADRAVAIAEVAEFTERAQEELDRQATEARQAVNALKQKLSEQAQTQVPQLEEKLYELANSAYVAANAALASKEYQNAIEKSAEGDDYLERAITKTHLATSVKSDLLKASRQIPKATVKEQRNSVLIRINGNVFSYGSMQLREEFFTTFNELARVLRMAKFKSYSIRIEAHTSSMGDMSVNQTISIGRADSVKKFLVDEGRMDPKRLTAVGLGETQPIVKEGANRPEQNRRIDIIIGTN